MKNFDATAEDFDRVVIKQRNDKYVGVESTKLSRNTIGMVLHGEKYIQQDDQTIRVSTGDIFFMGLGSHLVENVPSASAPFEQISFHFSASQLQHVVASFDQELLDIATREHSDEKLRFMNVAEAKASKITRNFFLGVNSHYECRGFIDDKMSEQLKLTELAHNIIKHEGGDIRRLLMMSLDSERATFERVIYSNILKDKSIANLADECRRSVTSFKKEFKSIFNTPPHQWYLRQRLNHARLLLSTTHHTIAQVGTICTFPNTSHFIKLFKRRFGMTPATYRQSAKCNSEDNIEAIAHNEREFAMQEA